MTRPQDWLLIGLFALGVAILRCRADPSVDTMKTFSGITGGKTVEPNSLPWMAKEWRKGCGATIICPRYVLSAARCYDDGYFLYVEVGAHKTKCGNPSFGCSSEPSRKWHKVKKVIRHPQHDVPRKHNYNFALLELKEPIAFKPEVKALRLSSTSAFGEDNIFVVSGWGFLSESIGSDGFGYPAKELQSVSLPKTSDELCQSIYTLECFGDECVDQSLTEAEMCIGGGPEVAGICTSDYGGPAAWLDPKTKEVKVVGVASWQVGGGCGKRPAVFAKVSAVLDWINEVTGGCNEQTCKEGNCMNWDNLVEDARESFQKITPTPHHSVLNLTVDMRVHV